MRGLYFGAPAYASGTKRNDRGRHWLPARTVNLVRANDFENGT
jgi:hypothetical protein